MARSSDWILSHGTEDEQLAELERIILIERILRGLGPDGKDDHTVPQKEPK